MSLGHAAGRIFPSLSLIQGLCHISLKWYLEVSSTSGLAAAANVTAFLLSVLYRCRALDKRLVILMEGNWGAVGIWRKRTEKKEWVEGTALSSCIIWFFRSCHARTCLPSVHRDLEISVTGKWKPRKSILFELPPLIHFKHFCIPLSEKATVNVMLCVSYYNFFWKISIQIEIL